MNKKQLKIMGYFVLAVLLLNLILAAFRLISWTIFWVVILLGAVFAYKVLPGMKSM